MDLDDDGLTLHIEENGHGPVVHVKGVRHPNDTITRTFEIVGLGDWIEEHGKA